MKARLEAQRQELQEDLDDTVRNHVVSLQTEGLTEMQEQLADNLDEWRNEL
jgi:ABC-type phosphate transport system auxiliary subunit